MTPIPKALADEAQDRWQILVQTLQKMGITLSISEEGIDLLRRALVFSDFVYRQILHRPELWPDLIESLDLSETYGRPNYENRINLAFEKSLGQGQMLDLHPSEKTSDPAITLTNKSTVMGVLRKLRHREMVRIAIRDICGWSDLEETMADLSALAEACLEGALRFLYTMESQRWGKPLDQGGRPQQMVVIGLGKLGAGELNFSSDVDLMFAYPANGQTAGGEKGQITNEEFFIKLTRELIQMIGQTTADGFIFRVDSRLRPYGESGPLVMQFDRLVDYYQNQGREWERYALIKARVVAGDHGAGQNLLTQLKPFVFRRYLDYGAFDSLRQMKSRIDLEIKSKGLQNNIKLGPGGIREIEFFGQMFQLIRGGIEPGLQIRPVRRVLQELARSGYIDVSQQTMLDRAYVFFRTVEHRIQQWADQQDHQLPTNPDLQMRLAASLGYEGWASFLKDLDDLRRQVHGHFKQLLQPVHEDEKHDPETKMSKLLEGIWQGVVDMDQAYLTLRALGYHDPQVAVEQITRLHQDRGIQSLGQVGLDRLSRLLPLVLQAVAKAPRAEVVLDRIFDLIRSIHKRTAYLALMLENPSILDHLVTLTGASPWIADQLCRHPVLLDELLDPRTLYRPPLRHELDEELTRRLDAIGAEDLEYQMEALRIFKQVNLLRVAASDITDVLPLMKVSDHLSDIAESAITASATLCRRELERKYGSPDCRLADQPCKLGFAIIAYGKLGGLELGYGSDLDLVFLHAARDGQSSGGERSIDNTTYFARLGQRVLHMLTTHTGTGVLYEVDMRLRPSGDSGMLVSHMDGFAAYQRDNAWTWEHQALLRARAIFGDPVLQRQFEIIRRDILIRPRDGEKLRKEVADMRLRLRKQNDKTGEQHFDIKHGIGGIMDIEFIVQYLVLKFANQHPEIVRWTDNVRQLQSLSEANIIEPVTAFGLRRAYLIFRAMAHRLNLAQQPATVSAARFPGPRRLVATTWTELIGTA